MRNTSTSNPKPTVLEAMRVAQLKRFYRFMLKDRGMIKGVTYMHENYYKVAVQYWNVASMPSMYDGPDGICGFWRDVEINLMAPITPETFRTGRS